MKNIKYQLKTNNTNELRATYNNKSIFPKLQKCRGVHLSHMIWTQVMNLVTLDWRKSKEDLQHHLWLFLDMSWNALIHLKIKNQFILRHLLPSKNFWAKLILYYLIWQQTITLGGKGMSGSAEHGTDRQIITFLC